jgi:hypothetical protein
MARIIGRRFWEHIAWFVAVLIFVALFAIGYFAVRADLRLKSRLAAIRAAGDPASIAELEPAPVPDEENAAAILARISPRLDQFSKEYGRFFNTPIGKKYEVASERGQPPSKEQIEAIRAILKNYPDLEQSILSAGACEQYASKLDFSLGHQAFLQQLLDQAVNERTVNRFFVWRNELLLADGQQESGIKNSILAMRLARLQENEPTMASHLISIAMRSIAADQLYDAIAAGPVSPELHSEIDKELALHDDPDQFVRSLKTERAVCADWFNSQMSGHNAAVGYIFLWSSKEFETGSLDQLEAGVKLAPLPWHEVLGSFGQKNETQSQKSAAGAAAALMEPALQSGFEANARCLAVMRSLRIYNALRAFADKDKREAKGLEELNMPKAAVIDPYSGGPLKLKHTDDGWIVYSVMQNGTDDGGDFIDRKDFGVAPRRLRMEANPQEPDSPSDPNRDESEAVQ